MPTHDSITSICFTGHRCLTNEESALIKKRLTKLLIHLINTKELTDCYAGGAIGLDTIAAETVISLRAAHPQLKLHLILPCQGQENSWNQDQKTKYNKIKEEADTVRTLSPFFYNGCMQARNLELLRCSDLCIAYLRKGTSRGGSLHTVLQATKIGIPIINIADIESEIVI